MERQISVMVKPASSNCNLRCEYCFYHSLATKRESYSHGMMTLETMENIIVKALRYANGGRMYLSFQGGEPLLRGKDFFREVKKMIARHNVLGSEVVMVIQTNGTLIDEEWCDIFEDCLIGVSLDGPRDINAYRVDKEGNPSFDRVYDAISLLEARHIDYNVLSVVTRKVANNGGEIYDTFKSWGFKYLQFIPCLKPFGEPETEGDMYMTGREYGEFLWSVFKRYFNDFVHGSYISIRMFDNFVRLVAGKSAEQCGMNGHCTRQFVIEGDGDVYPCDFYCLDEYRLGNVNSDDFETMGDSSVANNFIKESMVIEDRCRECRFYALCRNGCKRERADIEKCTAYKYFFTNALPMLKILAPYS